MENGIYEIAYDPSLFVLNGINMKSKVSGLSITAMPWVGRNWVGIARHEGTWLAEAENGKIC